MPIRLQQEKWFLLGLFIAPFLAWVNPAFGLAQGPLHTEILNQVAIAAIFFLSGLGLHFKELWSAAKNHRLNLATQLFCFGAIPLLMLCLARFVLPYSGMTPAFILGALLMACMPITTTSCVIFTSIAKGDTVATLFNATLSNIIGVFIAPITLAWLLGLHTDEMNFEPWPMIATLLQIIILPLFLGQLLAFLLEKINITEHLLLYNRISKWILVFLVYTAFCQSFQAIGALQNPGVQLSLLIVWMLLIHMLFLGIAYVLGKGLQFPEDQLKSFVLTAPQKTVVVGIPLNMALWGDQVGFVLLPLLIYNNVQWLGSAYVVGALKGEKHK